MPDFFDYGQLEINIMANVIKLIGDKDLDWYTPVRQSPDIVECEVIEEVPLMLPPPRIDNE